MLGFTSVEMARRDRCLKAWWSIHSIFWRLLPKKYCQIPKAATTPAEIMKILIKNKARRLVLAYRSTR